MSSLLVKFKPKFASKAVCCCVIHSALPWLCSHFCSCHLDFLFVFATWIFVSFSYFLGFAFCLARIQIQYCSGYCTHSCSTEVVPWEGESCGNEDRMYLEPS